MIRAVYIQRGDSALNFNQLYVFVWSVACLYFASLYGCSNECGQGSYHSSLLGKCSISVGLVTLTFPPCNLRKSPSCALLGQVHFVKGKLST